MAEEKAIQNLPLPQPYLQSPTTKQLLKLGNPFIVSAPTHNNKTYWIFLNNPATLSLLHRDRQLRIPSPVEWIEKIDSSVLTFDRSFKITQKANQN